MPDYHIVTVVPVYYQRKDCLPLQGGPWLTPKPSSHAWAPFAIGGWLLLLFASQGSPGVVGFLVGVAVFVGLLLALVHWTRHVIQVCPTCLQGMALTATRCPHCHYEPDAVCP